MKKTAILMTALTAASAHAAPVFNIFELGIKDGQSAAYDQIGDENIRTSLAKEPGTLAGGVLKCIAASNKSVVDIEKSDGKCFEVIGHLLGKTAGFAHRAAYPLA